MKAKELKKLSIFYKDEPDPYIVLSIAKEGNYYVVDAKTQASLGIETMRLHEDEDLDEEYKKPILVKDNSQKDKFAEAVQLAIREAKKAGASNVHHLEAHIEKFSDSWMSSRQWVLKFENTQGNHNKYYYIAVDYNVVETAYGRIGNNPIRKSDDIRDHARAMAYAAKKIRDKVKKGYLLKSISTHRDLDEVFSMVYGDTSSVTF